MGTGQRIVVWNTLEDPAPGPGLPTPDYGMNRREFLQSGTLIATATIMLPAELSLKHFAGTTKIEAAIPKVIDINFAQDEDDWQRNLASYHVLIRGYPGAGGNLYMKWGKLPMEWLEDSSVEDFRNHPVFGHICRNFDMTGAEINIEWQT